MADTNRDDARERAHEEEVAEQLRSQGMTVVNLHDAITPRTYLNALAILAEAKGISLAELESKDLTEREYTLVAILATRPALRAISLTGGVELTGVMAVEDGDLVAWTQRRLAPPEPVSLAADTQSSERKQPDDLND